MLVNTVIVVVRPLLNRVQGLLAHQPGHESSHVADGKLKRGVIATLHADCPVSLAKRLRSTLAFPWCSWYFSLGNRLFRSGLC